MHSFISSWILISPLFTTLQMSYSIQFLGEFIVTLSTLDLHYNFANLINLMYSLFVLMYMKFPLEFFAKQFTLESQVLIYLNKSRVYLFGEMFLNIMPQQVISLCEFDGPHAKVYCWMICHTFHKTHAEHKYVSYQHDTSSPFCFWISVCTLCSRAVHFHHELLLHFFYNYSASRTS